MPLKRSLILTVPLLMVALLLAACGAGKQNPNDIYPNNPATAAVSGPNSFLLFPNPQIQPDNTSQLMQSAYSAAYYRAIDPGNTRDTLVKYLSQNQFGSKTTGPLGEVSAIYGDWRDLGYGRRITMRQNTDGTIAIVAYNYIFDGGGGTYGSNAAMNLQAAVDQDPTWYIGATAIEYSPAPGVTPTTNCGNCFAKFFFYAPDGTRALLVSLDGRAKKAIVEVCSTCHGGRGDPLTPATGSPSSQPLFALVQNSTSLARGDIGAHPHPIEVDSLNFPDVTGMRRADQEAVLKTMNKMLLCTFPLANGATSSYAEDACRRTANAYEWQGGADFMIKDAYGGNGLPNPTWGSIPVPTSWQSVGQSTLYQNVVEPACRVCHVLRGVGSGAGDDVSLDTYSLFDGYSDRIKAHIIDRGNMPLSMILYDRFWSTATMYDTLGTYLQGKGYTVTDSSGAWLHPGRPVAAPGPDRALLPNVSATLSAADSLYASTYSWSVTSAPAGAGTPLTNTSSVQATFLPTVTGNYQVQLVVGNGTVQSPPAMLNIVVTASAPAATIHFPDIKAVLQSTTAGCTTCHTITGGGTSLTSSAITPLVYTNVDRNGDGTIDSGAPGSIDDLWFYTEVRGRVNFTDVGASKLLTKPSGHHHYGGLRTGFDTSKPPGDPARASYDLFLNWILNGAPQ